MQTRNTYKYKVENVFEGNKPQLFCSQPNFYGFNYLKKLGSETINNSFKLEYTTVLNLRIRHKQSHKIKYELFNKRRHLNSTLDIFLLRHLLTHLLQ